MLTLDAGVVTEIAAALANLQKAIGHLQELVQGGLSQAAVASSPAAVPSTNGHGGSTITVPQKVSIASNGASVMPAPPVSTPVPPVVPVASNGASVMPAPPPVVAPVPPAVMPAPAAVMPAPPAAARAVEDSLAPLAKTPAPQVAAPAPPVATPSCDSPELVGQMLAVVSEKTGYPVEMLDLSMALESDLGIDSIKRVE
ncbi:hypothetical protein H7J50_26185, partial [Mycobacterium intermedium]|nr:hypothetical protein [Mycobacterium intermedium]